MILTYSLEGGPVCFKDRPTNVEDYCLGTNACMYHDLVGVFVHPGSSDQSLEDTLQYTTWQM